MSQGYQIYNQNALYYLTFQIVDWVDIFTRQTYKDIVLESLAYCQKEKGLQIYTWCIMSNHVHFIMSSSNNTLSETLRDFKKFTSKKIIEAITNNEKESRKEWMLAIFKKAGESNSRNSNFQFWRQDNHPIELFSEPFIEQKLRYLHMNPVESGIVEKEEEYLYSSCRDYYEGKNIGKLKIEWL